MARPRTTLEVSDAFFNDALDLLRRYKHTAEIFWWIKSRRLKLFVDLRIAYECILKSRFAYDADPQTSREALIKQIEAYGHRIDRLLRATESSLPSAAVDTAKRFEKAIAKLPVSLRYKLDGFDFLSANEQLYYQTIVDPENWTGC